MLEERRGCSCGVEISHSRWRPESVQYRTVQYSTVQYSTVQYSTVQYSTVDYRTVQYNTVQYSTVQHSTVRYGTVQSSTVKYSTVQHITGRICTSCFKGWLAYVDTLLTLKYNLVYDIHASLPPQHIQYTCTVPLLPPPGSTSWAIHWEFGIFLGVQPSPCSLVPWDGILERHF